MAKQGAEHSNIMPPGADDELLVITQPCSGVIEISLNRPATRNSLSLAMLEAIGEAITAVADDNNVKAVILSARGPVFSAGHDLKELTSHRTDADGGRAFFETVMQTCSSVMQAVVASPKPVIAAVQGTATAAGCQLVASCDLAVAASTAKFCTPGVNIGLFCSTPMVALSRNVSRKHAMEMLLLGEMVDAPTAALYGLINRAVDDDQVAAVALEFATTIAAKSQATVSTGKAAFYRQLEMGLTEAYDYASAVMVENLMAEDSSEGICAFLEKRKPRWSNG